MPCRDGGPDCNVQDRLDSVTRIACWALGRLDYHNKYAPKEYCLLYPDFVQVWWAEHKQHDAERLRREQERDHQKRLVESARTKLTEAEFNALRSQ